MKGFEIQAWMAHYASPCWPKPISRAARLQNKENGLCLLMGGMADLLQKDTELDKELWPILQSTMEKEMRK